MSLLKLHIPTQSEASQRRQEIIKFPEFPPYAVKTLVWRSQFLWVSIGSEVTMRSVRCRWSAYAKAYASAVEHNPAYQAILQDFEAFLGDHKTPQLIL